MGLEPQPIETRGRTATTSSEKRRAAVHIADRIAAEHPAGIPAGARAELLDLIDALGLSYDDIRRGA